MSLRISSYSEPSTKPHACPLSLEQIYHDLPEIQYEVTLLNGESHIPAEEYGMLTVHTILLVFLAGGGVFGLMQLREQQNALGSLHLVSKLLAGA